MNAMKRALLAGTILPMMLSAPLLAQPAHSGGGVTLAQAQPGEADRRRPGGGERRPAPPPQQSRPAAPPPQVRQAAPPQQSRPAAPPIQQARPPVAQPTRPQAPAIQQARPPVQPTPPRAPAASSPPAVRSAQPPAATGRPSPPPPAAARPAVPPAASSPPAVRSAQPPAAAGRPSSPPPAAARPAVPPAAGQAAPLRPGTEQDPARRPQSPGIGQRPPAEGSPPAQPPVVSPRQQQPAPGAIRSPDGRPPFAGGTQPDQQQRPGQQDPGRPGIGQRPGTPPPVAQPGQQQRPGQQDPARPGIGQRPGMPPPVAQPDQQQRPGQQDPARPGIGQPQGMPPPVAQPGQQQPARPGFAGQPPSGPPEQRRGSRIGPAGAAAIGAGAGLVGGFMLGQGARAERVDQIRERRREFTQDGVTVIHEPGRTIVRDGEGVFIRHDENARFRELGGQFHSERRGDDFVSVYERPGGVRIITVTDENGQLVRRVRRYPDGREMVLIDNRFRPRPRTFEDQIVVLPPPRFSLPRERYIVDAGVADEGVIYEALTAPPVAPPPRRFTLDEVRYSPSVRAYTRSVDLDTISFDTGSWDVRADQARRLEVIARVLGRAIEANPNEVFLVEGHTDAVGGDVDNLSLSDRRAQSVAAILTQTFNIPPENLTTQGYGEQYLKVQTQGASQENRRVTVRRITELLNQQSPASPQ